MLTWNQPAHDQSSREQSQDLAQACPLLVLGIWSTLHRSQRVLPPLSPPALPSRSQRSKGCMFWFPGGGRLAGLMSPELTEGTREGSRLKIFLPPLTTFSCSLPSSAASTSKQPCHGLRECRGQDDWATGCNLPKDPRSKPFPESRNVASKQGNFPC